MSTRHRAMPCHAVAPVAAEVEAQGVERHAVAHSEDGPHLLEDGRGELLTRCGAPAGGEKGLCHLAAEQVPGALAPPDRADQLLEQTLRS